MDEDVVALMYEFEMQRATIESYKEGTHADLMEMAQSFLDLSTYSFQSTMGVRGLWRGNTVNVLRMIPNKGVLHATNDLYKALFVQKY